MPVPLAQPSRLVSLDVLRGIAVMGMLLANASAYLKYGGHVAVFPFLLHAHWDGLRPADLVFPAFILMVGISIPLSLARVRPDGTPAGPAGRRIGWRVARLFGIGLVLTNLEWLTGRPDATWAFWDVLQRIALVYGACALLFLRTSGKTRAILIVILLLAYWPITLLPSLDGVATNLWEAGHNFPASVDRAMFGGHTWVDGLAGYDPEGLVGTLPAIAQGLLGVALGEFLLRQPGRNHVRFLLGAGAVLLAAGLAWGTLFPIVKDLWSSSFVLVTSGLTIVAFAVLRAGLDFRAPAAVPVGGLLLAVPVAFGTNAITAYVLHAVVAPVLSWEPTVRLVRAASARIGEPAAALLAALLFLAFVWGCLEFLRRRRWFLKV